jgi:hypothetical protein
VVIILVILLNLVRDSVVGIATGYGLDDRGVRVRVPVGSRIFSCPRRPDQLWDHPASYPVGTGVIFHGIKRLGREADHSSPASAEVKKMWIYTSTPPYAFTSLHTSQNFRFHASVISGNDKECVRLFIVNSVNDKNELLLRKMVKPS